MADKNIFFHTWNERFSPLVGIMGIIAVESSWNAMAHGDTREGKWRGSWRMESVASTLHTTSEHGVSSITAADAHISVASSRLNWRPLRFKWTRPFRRKTNSGICSCAVTFQTQSTNMGTVPDSSTTWKGHVYHHYHYQHQKGEVTGGWRK